MIKLDVYYASSSDLEQRMMFPRHRAAGFPFKFFLFFMYCCFALHAHSLRSG